MKRPDTNDLKQLIRETTLKLKTVKDNFETNILVENLIRTVMNTEFASLWIFNKQDATLVRERNDGTLREISMLGQHGVLAKCFFTLSSGVYNYLASEKEYLPEVDNPDNIRIKSKIIVPIIDGEHFLGMVTAYSSIMKIKNFTQDDLDILEALVPFLTNVIYTMYPEMKTKELTDVYISDRLLKESESVVEKVEEIQQEQQKTESVDTTLNFLANTVHDIRTPANSLYGFLELLEDQLEDKRLLQYIHNAKESAYFINDLTTSILDRISSQRERNKAKPIALNPRKFFADIAETFSANMYSKEFTYNIYIDPKIPKEVIIEEMMLKRILMNLLNNAYKFTPSKQTITLSIQYEQEEKKIKVSVADTGIGIAKEKQNEIFKAFTQAEEDTKLNYGGTGLGLTICAEYVKELGGQLKLKSELDKGSNFYFTLPLNITDAETMLAPVSGEYLNIGICFDKKNIPSSKNLTRYLLRMGVGKEQIKAIKNNGFIDKTITHIICFQDQLNQKIIHSAKQQKVPLLVIEERFMSLLGSEHTDFDIISQYGYYADTLHKFLTDTRPMRILVADDDKINIALIKAILEDEFCQVDTATDGQTALKLLKEGIQEGYPYSIVYLDKYMPILSGPEVINTFRHYENTQKTKRIFAISISGDENREDKGGSMFDMYVGKPFNKNAIKETIELARDL